MPRHSERPIQMAFDGNLLAQYQMRHGLTQHVFKRPALNPKTGMYKMSFLMLGLFPAFSLEARG